MFAIMEKVDAGMDRASSLIYPYRPDMPLLPTKVFENGQDCTITVANFITPLLKMLLTSGIAALLGIALVGAKTPLPEGILKEPPSARDHSAQALRSPFSPRGRQASNIIPGMYLVEFSDGHVRSPGVPLTLPSYTDIHPGQCLLLHQHARKRHPAHPTDGS